MNANQAMKKYKEDFIDKHGYVFCEACLVSNAYRFSVHHLVYRSEASKHKNLHDQKNLYLCCNDCHLKFHGGQYKDKFAQLEKERELKELFN